MARKHHSGVPQGLILFPSSSLAVTSLLNNCKCVFCTFIEADFVPQNDHPFSEQLVLKVFSEEGAQLGL